MAACDCCAASRLTGGLYRLFDPKCLHCGARLIQQIGALPIPASEATKRRKAVLKDWCQYGHSETELRALAKAEALPLEPVAKGPRK